MMEIDLLKANGLPSDTNVVPKNDKYDKPGYSLVIPSIPLNLASFNYCDSKERGLFDHHHYV